MAKMTCGEATIKLLSDYGVTTVFGIPGVHTLEFCRGLGDHVNHIQARNEQGAGFMAEGWARATGEPGVALVISGPGVTNSITALAQCYGDSLPMLLLSAEPPLNSLGKGWGVLHEITDQRKTTEPVTAFSVTIERPEDVPEQIAKAFAVFKSQRPRPVHISIPIDIQAMPVDGEWKPVVPKALPNAERSDLQLAAEMLRSSKQPVIIAGGGAAGCGESLVAIAEATGAIICTSSAGKGIVPESHPLSMGGASVRPVGRAILESADVVLAIGTELSETLHWVDRLQFSGELIRVDIDPEKIDDLYRPKIGIVADAVSTSASLRELLAGHLSNNRESAESRVANMKSEISQTLAPFEKQHVRLLTALDEIAPADTIFSGDACQIVYTGVFAMPRNNERGWFYPAGYCALGNAVPNAIGAKFAKPDSPVSVLVGDGGFMFTMPEILVAAEHKLPIPIIIWQNGGYKQIWDDMDNRNIERVGVEGLNPDFVALAHACHCHGVRPTSMDQFRQEWTAALNADRPTLIVVEENSDWLA